MNGGVHRLDPDIKRKLERLPLLCQSTTEQLTSLGFSPNWACVFPSSSVAVSACHPLPCFHSISENNCFYINYKVPARGCPRTSCFISAQTLHGLPGTTSVTRTPASPSYQQPRQRGNPRPDTRAVWQPGKFCKSCCCH